jgi:TonB family protein
MKKLLLIFSFFGLDIVYAQKTSTDLYQHWVKDDLIRKDSSRILDMDLLDSEFDMNIYSKDSLRFKANGRASNYKYKYESSLLSFGSFVFGVQSLSDYKLCIFDALESDPSKSLMIIMVPKKLKDLGLNPEKYKAKNGEWVYKRIPQLLEPTFMDKNMNPLDFVFEKFGFPEYRKGGFVVRFIVNSSGELGGVKVLASTNDKYNENLVKAVKKTKGKWLPATYQGEKINVELTYDYNLGYEERKINSQVDSIAYSTAYYNSGMEMFNAGSYKMAERYFKKAMEFNPFNISAYYQHAAASVALRNYDEACKDYQQLIFLDQKKAKKLMEKVCKK